MKISVLSILACVLCITILIPDVHAGKRRHGGSRGNQCDAVGLSLASTTVDLLAGKGRDKVGTVTLSTDNGNLVSKVKVIHGCSLAGFVKLNVFEGSSLSSASIRKFPCGSFAYQQMQTLTCPINKFSNIKDCCAEHFVIVLVAAVKCGRHKTLAFAGSSKCSGNKDWCSFVPVKLLPGCKGRGCTDDTPFTEVCKNNKCEKKPEPPCLDTCDLEGNAIMSTCDPEKGCVDTLEKCMGRCEGNKPFLSECVGGECKDKPQDPCVNTCDENVPVMSTCVDGECKLEEKPPCKDKCDGNTPVMSVCLDGACKETEKPPCVSTCDKNVPTMSTCVDGECKEEEKPPCKDKCDGNTPVMSVCLDGACKETEKPPCVSTCHENVPIMSTCVDGKCKEEKKPPCKDRCDGKSLIISKCKGGKCEETVTSCGKCGSCTTRGRKGPRCKMPRCGRGKVLNEEICKCCPKCKKHYVLRIKRGRCRCVYKH